MKFRDTTGKTTFRKYFPGTVQNLPKLRYETSLEILWPKVVPVEVVAMVVRNRSASAWDIGSHII
jgi:hypothetical protein